MTPDASPSTLVGIDLQPLGEVPAATTTAISRRLSRCVGVPCRAVTPIPASVLPRLAHRPQLDADAVLRLLEDQDRDDGVARVGLTNEDLGHPLFTFFFGRARMGGAAVVSLHRLDPAFYGLPASQETTLRRGVLECLHELGHVAGLHHCDDYACVMHFSGEAEMIDLRGRGFCERCGRSLPTPLRHALHA
jgi:archaemetzincin